jgi:FkbM family methyltransferase
LEKHKYFKEDSMSIDEQIYDYMIKRLNNDSIVVDVGAYIGKTATNLMTRSKGNPSNYYLIECCPNNFQKLKEKCPESNLFELAISDKNGEVDFYVGNHPNIEGSSQSNSLVSDFIEEKEWNKKTIHYRVKSMTLDKFYETNNLENVRFLKINCEGGEYEILGKESSTFTFTEVTDFIYLQLHGKTEMFLSDEYIRKKRNIIEKFRSLGFEPVLFDHLDNFPKGHVHILFEKK